MAPLLTITLNGTDYVREDAARLEAEQAATRERLRIRREFLAVVANRLEEGYMRQLLDRIAPEEWPSPPIAEPLPSPTPDQIDLMQAIKAGLVASGRKRQRRAGGSK